MMLKANGLETTRLAIRGKEKVYVMFVWTYLQDFLKFYFLYNYKFGFLKFRSTGRDQLLLLIDITTIFVNMSTKIPFWEFSQKVKMNYIIFFIKFQTSQVI